MKIKNVVWDVKNYKKFRKYLISLGDKEFSLFQSKLCNTKYPIIGIKVPIMRNICNDILNSDINSYLESFNPIYYEEVFIYGLVISSLKDSLLIDKYLMNFIKYVDNWAVCDSFCSNMKIIKNKMGKYWIYFNSLIDINNEYYTRISIVIFKDYYLCDQYIDRVLYVVKNIKCNYYYVNMAISWLLQETYIKYEDKVIDILKSKELDKFIQNKTISKICDSYKVSKINKEKIKEYRM